MVSPAARRQGVATRLLTRAEEQAKTSGLARLALYVDVDNEPALRCYEGFGFRETTVEMLPDRYRRFGLTGFRKLVKELPS